jgi:hypothetical protein
MIVSRKMHMQTLVLYFLKGLLAPFCFSSTRYQISFLQNAKRCRCGIAQSGCHVALIGRSVAQTVVRQLAE